MLTSALVLAAATQLVGANVSVLIDGDTARVTARYQLQHDGPFAYRAPRIPRQSIHWYLQPVPFPVDSLSGLLRIRAIGAVRDTVIFHFSYAVTGRLGRIPLLVPDIPTDPATVPAITLTVRGVPGFANLQNGFPRMARRVDGSVISSPANLPSFLVVPLRSQRFSTDRVADAFVIVLLMFASGFWVYHARKRLQG